MMLRVEDIHAFYRNGQFVLTGLGFSLKAGQILAILGPNGAGKTTLLRCINAIIKPVRGTVFVENTDVSRMSSEDIARRLGYVAQHNEAGRITVFDAVLLGRKPHIRWRVTENDFAMANNALNGLGLRHLSLRYLNELSGGELQRVCIARALAQEPKILLLDEPINHLDPVNQIEVMSLLRVIARDRNIASLVVTHDLNSALRFADRFLLLKQGRLLAAGGKDIITPEIIRETFGINVTIGEVGGVTVVVPKLHGIHPHRHVDESGRFREHAHEVDDPLYDHEHS